jgi:hypothetical protein
MAKSSREQSALLRLAKAAEVFLAPSAEQRATWQRDSTCLAKDVRTLLAGLRDLLQIQGAAWGYVFKPGETFSILLLPSGGTSRLGISRMADGFHRNHCELSMEFDPAELISSSAHAIYCPTLHRIKLPIQAMFQTRLPTDDLLGGIAHEVRHGMSRAKLLRGESSLFYGEVYPLDSWKAPGIYSKGFTVDEIFCHGHDCVTLARRLTPNIQEASRELLSLRLEACKKLVTSFGEILTAISKGSVQGSPTFMRDYCNRPFSHSWIEGQAIIEVEGPFGKQNFRFCSPLVHATAEDDYTRNYELLCEHIAGLATAVDKVRCLMTMNRENSRGI